MKQLTTKSQMIERIAELSEQVENLNRQLDIAIKENNLLFCNATDFRQIVKKYATEKNRSLKRLYKRNLDYFIKMSNSEWFDYMYKE